MNSISRYLFLNSGGASAVVVMRVDPTAILIMFVFYHLLLVFAVLNLEIEIILSISYISAMLYISAQMVKPKSYYCTSTHLGTE